MTRPPQPSDVFMRQFAQAAAYACVFELRVRMLADMTSALRKQAFRPLSELLSEVLEYYNEALSAEDRAALDGAAVLRNKLLHLELSRATGKLVALREQLDAGQVLQGTFEDGEVRQVSKTSTADGRIFGWLLESSTSGAFTAAQKRFDAGIEIIERLVLVAL